MINRISKTFLINHSYYASFQNKTMIKPKPTMIKPPPMKPKLGQLLISTVAQKFKINQQTLRKQLSDPKVNYITQQQFRALEIINNMNFSNRQLQKEISMIKKSPVITIMGHVDHGKTTLIDYLRSSNIAQGQVGGITQKIGAFHIDCHGQKITFIDTPGHQAFSNMRQRGAKITDLIVLVVASTEGVKKQTQQVINIIKRDQIPTIVAISKIDLPTADVESVQASLFEAGLNIQPRGGNIPVVHISAKTGKNIDFLTQLILQETKELKAIQQGLAEGFVLEAYQNSKGFNAMTLIVNKGILKIGSIIIVGDQYAKIKNLYDDKGKQVQKARPGDAVQIIGIPNIPLAGDFVFEIGTEKQAKFISTKRKQKLAQQLQKQSDKSSVKTSKLKLDYRTRKRMYNSATNDAWLQQFKLRQEQLMVKIDQLRELAISDPKFNEVLELKEKELQEHKKYVYEFLVNIGVNKNCFNVIMKFSDRGIQQTISQQLEPIIEKLKANNNITVNILRSNIGEVVTNDIEDASISNAQIFTFGVQVHSQALQAQKRFLINPKCHKLIHNFMKDFQQSAVSYKKNMSFKGIQKGRALIAEVYNIKGKKGEEQVPGLKITNGKIQKKHKLYILRNDTPISEAIYIKAIKVFKKEMQQVKKGDQCTITLQNIKSCKFEKGDEIVAFEQS